MFGHFCPNGDFFQKNPVLSHNYKWAPKTMLSFRKKPMNQSRENFRTDRRRDRRMDGQTDLFDRTLPAKAGDSKTLPHAFFPILFFKPFIAFAMKAGEFLFMLCIPFFSFEIQFCSISKTARICLHCHYFIVC